MAPGNIIFFHNVSTLTWQNIPEESELYMCTALCPNGNSYTINVTNGTTSVHYDLRGMNISGNITFEVQAVNCAGAGPKGYYTNTEGAIQRKRAQRGRERRQ